VEKLEKYFKDVLGEHIVVQKLENKDLRNIPMFMSYNYTFYKTRLFNRDVVFMSVPDESQRTTSQYKIHVEIAIKAFKCLVILVLPRMQSYNRLRLIEKRLNFIIPGTQLYLPDLLIDFREISVSTEKVSEFIKPSTQVLLLYPLLIEQLDTLNFKTIAEKLSYSNVSVTYAVNELLAHNICTVKGKKNKQIVFNKDKRELWDIAEPMMTSPVLKMVYTDENLPVNEFCIASINALSHYTDIAGERQDYYAVSNQKYLSLGLKNIDYREGRYCLEVWKYDPLLLTKDKYVDPLSLYLTFRNDTNERVEAEMKKLKEITLW
jgi:hypothetical protein